MIEVIISSNRSGNDLASFEILINPDLKGAEREAAIVEEIMKIIEWREK